MYIRKLFPSLQFSVFCWGCLSQVYSSLKPSQKTRSNNFPWQMTSIHSTIFDFLPVYFLLYGDFKSLCALKFRLSLAQEENSWFMLYNQSVETHGIIEALWDNILLTEFWKHRCPSNIYFKILRIYSRTEGFPQHPYLVLSLELKRRHTFTNTECRPFRRSSTLARGNHSPKWQAQKTTTSLYLALQEDQRCCAHRGMNSVDSRPETWKPPEMICWSRTG